MGEEKIHGLSKVYCRGRFISGPDARSCIATLVMIGAPSILWQIDVGSFLIERSGLMLPLLNGAALIASMVFLLMTALSDPGIVPRQEPFTEQYDVSTEKYRVKQPPRYFELFFRGHNLKLKYCTTCSLYRPPRCTHCSVCENCVERFDHHCPWIGNCVGRRNYRSFYAFVLSTAVLNVVTVVTAALKVVIIACEDRRGDDDSLGRILTDLAGDVPMTVALTIYSVGLVWFTVGLGIYHTYLICTSQTTYEQVKGAYLKGSNPFDLGFIRNFEQMLCSPVRPRYFDARTGSLRWPPNSVKKKDAPSQHLKL